MLLQQEKFACDGRKSRVWGTLGLGCASGSAGGLPVPQMARPRRPSVWTAERHAKLSSHVTDSQRWRQTELRLAISPDGSC